MGRTFESYGDAKKYFQGQITTKEKRASFAKDDEPPPDENKFHDVMLCMFMSDLIYTLGMLRGHIATLGHNLETLNEELNRLYDDGEDKIDLARLMTGHFKLNDDDGDGIPNPPKMDFNQLEQLILDPKFKQVCPESVIKYCACELTVVTFESFKKSNIKLYRFEAKYDQNQLVYAICVREKDEFKDLVLSFRGSSTLADWLQNVQVPLVEILVRHDIGSDKAYLVEQGSCQTIEIHVKLYHKLKDALSLDEGDATGGKERVKLMVHAGMLEYLFSTFNGKRDHTMYEKIRNDLVELCNGDISSILITGHSLGGGLATLTSFLLACDKSFTPSDSANKKADKVAKCIAFADPCVGNVGFQRAMAVLAHYKKEERKGTVRHRFPSREIVVGTNGEKTPLVSHKEGGHSHLRLQYVRFQNDRDAVPMLFPLPGYRATGIKVHLRKSRWGSPGGSYSIHRDHPLMDESSTSFWSGLSHMIGPFLGLLITTLPVVVLVLVNIVYFIIKIVMSLSQVGNISTALSPFFMNPMLTFSMFATLAVAIVSQICMGMIRKKTTGDGEFEHAIGHTKILCIGIALFVGIPIVNTFFMTGPDSSSKCKTLVAGSVVLGMVYTFWSVRQPMPTLNWTRIISVIAAIPLMIEGVLYVVSDKWYALSIEFGPIAISVGLILLQIAMLVRSPWDVTSARTHSLRDYYDNMRPFHTKLSRSGVIMDAAPTQ